MSYDLVRYTSSSRTTLSMPNPRYFVIFEGLYIESETVISISSIEVLPTQCVRQIGNFIGGTELGKRRQTSFFSAESI